MPQLTSRNKQVLSFIQEFATAHGYPPSIREIAAHLGTVRDIVGRTLRAFADAGLVQMERQRIVLLDREGLEAEAER